MLISSGLISGSEVALFSLSKTQLKNKENNNQINIISKLLSTPNKLLATILVANNFINIGIVILFTQIGEIIFINITSSILKFILEVVVATFLILLFGEILPKIYANRNNLKFSKIVAYPLLFLDIFFTPASIPMQRFSNFIKNRLSFKSTNINVDKLTHALDLTSTEDTTIQEQKILKGILTFGNTETKEIMIPRMDIYAFNYDVTFKDVLKNIVNNVC